MGRKIKRETLYRIAIASCFLGHGYIAVKNSSVFYSQWSNWIQSLFSPEMQYTSARYFLLTVGIIDILVGLLFLLPRIPRTAYVWAIGWGFATAASRLYFLSSFSSPVAQGLINPLSEFLVRLPNGGLPLILYLKTYHGLSEKKGFALLSKAIAVAMCLHFTVQLNHPILSFELAKEGMPQAYFFLSGLLACLAVATPYGLLALIAYTLPEGFEIFMRAQNNGFLPAFIQFAEHLPVFSVLYFAGRSSSLFKIPTFRSLQASGMR